MTRSIVTGADVLIDMGANPITNVTDPTNDQDAATKKYVDDNSTSVTFGTPAVVLGTTAAAGSTDEVIRKDSTIVAFDATSPSTQAFGDAAAVGVATVAARRDHKHAMPATPTTVSGNAGTATALATARNIDGQSFNGTADITVIAPGTHAATTKATPADADELPLVDSAASNVLKKLTWANLKATIKTYTDTLYPSGSGTSSGTNTGDQTTVSGNAGTATALQNARTINGTSFNGTANIVTAMGTMARSPRSSNTILAAADRGTVICATAAFTQTLTAAATLAVGWWCIVKNDTQDGTTVLVLDPNASETIDGLTTITMYSGETRLIECDGSNFTSQLLDGGYAKFTPTGGNFIVPAGITQLHAVCVGGGGGGGGGPSSVNTAVSGGGGGGGGAVSLATVSAAALTAAGTTITVTVGAAGSVGPGGTARGSAGSNAGTDGGNGNPTSFGTYLKAGGGGGGKAGTNAGILGGGGASTVNSGATSTAGAPVSTTAIGSQGASPTASANGNNAEWGGASGGSNTTNSKQFGGSSIYGGPGGGSGAGASAANGLNAGSQGGVTQSYTAGGGSVGANGSTTLLPYCGGGGGGAATSLNTTPSVGGDGGIGAGGGGGAACCSATSAATGGAGGAGGAGECRVWYF